MVNVLDRAVSLYRISSGELARRLTAIVPGRKPSWQRRPNLLPWFDLPDAHAVVQRRLSQGTITKAQAELLDKWILDGYVVVDGGYPSTTIDEMTTVLDDLWEAKRAIPGLTLLRVRDQPGGPERDISHRELLRLDLQTRRRIRDLSDWRIHGFQMRNAAAQQIWRHRGLRETVGCIFGRPAHPIASINFMYGSQQGLHQDMAVFHIHPHNYLIGAWIACEDIAPDSGPLVYYPGSHRERMFAEFTDYPQTNLRTVDDAAMTRYQAFVDGLAKRYQRHHFLGKKGQVLLWHGMLIHGGEVIETPGRSRRSMVVHYSAANANRHFEVSGPFKW